MTGGSQSSPGPNGIEVSIVVSAVSRYSRGSVYLGCYLATLLAHGGSVGKVHVVPLPPDGDGVLKKNHHVYIPTLPLQVLRPNGKDLIVGDKEHGIECYGSLDTLKTSELIIICVDSPDTSRCIKIIQDRRMKGGSTNNKHVGIISMQRGVKNSSQFTDKFEKDKTVTILEGVPGLEIISSPMHDDALVSSSSKACLVLERLTRQKVKQQGVAMAEILESTGLRILYRKHLTTHTWGVSTLYGCLAAINALTGGPLRSDLAMDLKVRILVATMLRECRAALRKAAKGGKWAPDAESCCHLSLKWLEHVLCLPNPIYQLLAPLVLPLRDDLPSSFQMDLHDGLETSLVLTLGEIENVGKAYQASTPIIHAIIQRIKKIANKGEGAVMVSASDLYRDLGEPRAVYRQAMYVWLNVASALFLLCLLPLLLIMAIVAI